MRQLLIILACTAGLTLAGCMDARDERILTGAVIGAGAGFITAKVFDADSDWIVLTALTGAAIGALVARNTRTNECAYNNGDGRYRVRRCG